MHPFIIRYERVLGHYTNEKVIKLKFSTVNSGAFYHLKGAAAEICLDFAFKGDKAMLVKDAPNKATNQCKFKNCV